MKKLDWHRIIGNFLFMLPFSIFIQWFSNIFNQIMPNANSVAATVLYTVINFIGVGFIAVAISIYQRVNLVLHPADDLMQILRFKYFHGSAFKAMWASYIPPTIFAIIAFVITFPNLYNFGLGTIFAFLFQGGITGIADKYVFKNLKHQAIDVGN